MIASLARVGWMYAIALLLIGLAVTVAICADTPAPPAYLDKATYITETKCKMCHRAQFTAWNTTTHAKFNTKLPWENDTDKVELPAVDTVYRHTTGYKADSKTWSEKGITCEACHGPGSAHFTATKDNRPLTIVEPAKLKTPGQQISVCGRCHGQYTIDGQHAALKYKAGQDLLTTDGFKLDPVEADKPMQQLNEMAGSKHFAHGVVCITCHTSHSADAQPHSLKKPVNDLCNSCHKKTIAVHAPTAPADATCATCHMPKGAHTFAKPN